jgi:hypothetical protein
MYNCLEKCMCLEAGRDIGLFVSQVIQFNSSLFKCKLQVKHDVEYQNKMLGGQSYDSLVRWSSRFHGLKYNQ